MPKKRAPITEYIDLHEAAEAICYAIDAFLAAPTNNHSDQLNDLIIVHETLKEYLLKQKKPKKRKKRKPGRPRKSAQRQEDLAV